MKRWCKYWGLLLTTLLFSGCILSYSPLETAVTLHQGDSQSFSVRVMGTVQWYLNEAPIPGATGDAYVFSASETGEFSLKAKNEFIGQESIQKWTIRVRNPNSLTITGTPITSVQAGTPYAFTPTATSLDDYDLTFTIRNKPSWAIFDNQTGGLSGTPAIADAGITTGIIITVSDGYESKSLSPFDLTVTPRDPNALIITGTPITSVQAGTPYTFTPTANSLDDYDLTFTIRNRPGWANFDNQTGKLSGTPAIADAGITTGIIITVSDGYETRSLAPFDLTVTPGADTDDDGIYDYEDNCIYTPNPNQADADSNGKGDACEFGTMSSGDLAAASNNAALSTNNAAMQSGATMSASTSYYYDPPSRANDGDLITRWSNYTNFHSNDWLQVDLGVPTTVYSVNIINYIDVNCGMTSFALQYYNGSAWVTVGTYTTNRLNFEAIGIPVTGITAQRWRITNFSTFRNCVAIPEFQVNTPLMSASWSYSTSPPSKANDGNMTSYWSNDTNFNSNDWLQIDLMEPVFVGKVSIVNRINGTSGMYSFDLQFMIGNNWVTLNKYFSKGQDGEIIEIVAPNILASKLRITNFKLWDGRSCVSIDEFQINAPIMKTNYSHSSHPASHANDENTGTFWTDSGNEFRSGDYLQVEFAFPSKVTSIQIDNYVDAGTGMYSFQLQYFDGCDWVLEGTHTTNLRNHQVISITVDNVVARSFRITNFKYSNGMEAAGIYEFKIYGTPGDFDITCDGSLLSDEVWKVVAKASVDECFYGIGDGEYPIQSSCDGGELKKNEAYVWGMTQFEDNIFFGSGANVGCLAVNVYMEGEVDPYYRKNDVVCEFSANNLGLGDWRPPSLYMYSKENGYRRLVLPEWAHYLRYNTTGFRAAGAHPSGVVFIGGPNLADGIYLFAFNGRTGEFLDATELDLGYTSLRKMLVASDGSLYIGLGGSESQMVNGGAVVKWTGNPNAIFSGDLSTLFDFEFVGLGMDGEAESITEYNNRLIIATWPDPNLSYPGLDEAHANTAGIWMSPPLPLDSGDAINWKKYWSAGGYEPDPLIASTYGCGAIKAFDGWVYWGTMHVPGYAYKRYCDVYGEPYFDQEKREVVENVWREFSVFRGRNFGTSTQEIQLLYGGSSVFDLASGHYMVRTNWGNWQSQMNKMGQTPLYGRGGFDNEWNAYCWTMTLYNNHLYVGTFDYSWMVMEDTETVQANGYQRRHVYGGDLFRFDSADIPAVPVSIDGMGNGMNYGIRSMISSDDFIYIGTGNNANLSENGGWELIKLTTKSDRIEDPGVIPLPPVDDPSIGDRRVPGPYLTVIEAGVGPGSEYTVIRPSNLGENGVLHPILTWGNGTYANDLSPGFYFDFIELFASYGYVVVASNTAMTGDGTEMIAGLDWLIEENNTLGSTYYQKLNENKIGVFGHSQGGDSANIVAINDTRIKAAVSIEPSCGTFVSYNAANVRSPLFVIAGGEDTLVSPSSVQTYVYNRLTVPAVFGIHQTATHTSWIYAAFDEPILNWFNDYLMDGDTFSLENDSIWTVQSKNF